LKVDLARINHVLIPATKAERDRYRAGWLARRVQGIAWMASRTTREGRLLLAATCMAALFAVDVLRTETHVLVLATASIIFASLLFTRGYRLDGVRAESSAPRRVTVGEEITFTITLRNEGPAEHRCIRIERPLLSWDGKWSDAPPPVGRLAPGGRADVEARARFTQRGEHHIDRFRVAALLPMGLSQGRPLRTDGARFVVVPRIANVASIPSAVSKSPQPGESARASRSGEANDLRGVRAYRPGDSVRKLHARSWARHGAPMVREYQHEESSITGLVVDDGDDAGTDEDFEAALSLAAGVVARSLQGEAPVDWLFAGRTAERLGQSRSAGALDQALDCLAGAQRGEDFTVARFMARLGPVLEQLSTVVVVLLAWDAPRAAFVSAIRARGTGCVALVVGDRAPGGIVAAAVPVEMIRKGKAIAL
jgi:uncharacterized protein (DUF58 family)